MSQACPDVQAFYASAIDRDLVTLITHVVLPFNLHYSTMAKHPRRHGKQNPAWTVARAGRAQEKLETDRTPFLVTMHL
jgi:hypothetical protein